MSTGELTHTKDRRKFLDGLEKMKIEKTKFMIDKFYLMKSELTSEGPRYSILEEYNLS